MDPELLTTLREVVRIVDDKKAFQVIVYDVSARTSLADVFVLCSVGSQRQAQAVSDEIERVLRDAKIRPLSIEGYAQGGWVLMDYGQFVVHVFLEETREYYALERLWGDAPEIGRRLRAAE